MEQALQMKEEAKCWILNLSADEKNQFKIKKFEFFFLEYADNDKRMFARLICNSLVVSKTDKYPFLHELCLVLISYFL